MHLKGDALCSQAFGKAQGILDRDRGIPGGVPYESGRCLRIYVRFQTIISRPRQIPFCCCRIRPRKHFHTLPVGVFPCRDDRVSQNQPIRADYRTVFPGKKAFIVPVHTKAGSHMASCGKTTEDNGAAGAGSAHPAYGPGRLAKRRRSKGLAVDRYRVVQDPWFPPLCGKCLCHGKGLPWGVPPVRSPRADNHISLDAFRTSIAAIQSYLCQTGRGLQSCLCYVNCLPHPIHLYPSFT